MSGFPLASLGVAISDLGAGAGAGGPARGTAGPKALNQAGGCHVVSLAALTLAGTTNTTYTCPVSVHVVVISRTTVPFRRSVILPATKASAGWSGLFQSR